ncbi:MAG: 2-C-methyl-D-erythritol 2,4-cyclodiphosphate synthase [Pseudomonadota bacterium]
MRIGQGYDVHRLVTGRKLIIGGVTIPHTHGLEGHSDADVLLHAICDALLGAAALGDIGTHFPPSDERYKDQDSRVFTRAVGELLAERGWSVGNIDSTIVAQRPKMAPHIPGMVVNIAEDFGISPDAVNVKATTTEGLGFEGEMLGISASAVATIVSTQAAIEA